LTTIANLLDLRAVVGLAAVRAELAEQERAAAAAARSAPVSAVCPACGQRRQVPAVVFRDGR
jgi:hypothetical protein